MTIGMDILPMSGAPKRTGRGSHRWVIPVAIATVVALLGAGAAVAYGALAGGGAQPESVVPASAFGFVKVDFDPPATQKLAVLRLSRHFPAVHGTGIEDVRDSLLRPMLEHSGGPRYDSAVRPWLGQRAGFAGWVDAAGHPQALTVLQYTDADKARRGLADLAGGHQGYALAGGYVVLADSQRSADEAVAAARGHSLAAAGTYRADVESLHGGQLATAWVDLPAAVRAGTAQLGAGLLGKGLVPSTSGRLVLGVHAEADYLEVAGHTVGAAGPAAPGPAAGRLISTLPDSTALALAIGAPSPLRSELDRLLPARSSAAGQATGSGTGGLGALSAAGLDVLRDLPALLGDGAVLALAGDTGGKPSGGLRTHSTDPAATTRADEGLVRLAAAAGLEARTQLAPGGDVVLGVGPGYAATLAAGGRLGQTKRFQQVMGRLPSAPSAALYVDVTRLSSGFGLPVPADVKAVQAVGGWVGTDGGQQSFQLRVLAAG